MKNTKVIELVRSVTETGDSSRYSLYKSDGEYILRRKKVEGGRVYSIGQTLNADVLESKEPTPEEKMRFIMSAVDDVDRRFRKLIEDGHHD